MAKNDFTTTQDEQQSFDENVVPIHFVSNPLATVQELKIKVFRTCAKCGDLHGNRHLCNDCFDDVNNPKRPYGALTRKQSRKV